MMKESIYHAKEKIDLFLSIEEGDKQKFENLVCFCSRAMELSVKERLIKAVPDEGEIWTCDFGYNVGSEIDKIRPCVIKSRYINNKNSNMVTVAPITHTNQIFDTHVVLEDKLFMYKDDNIDGTIKVEQTRSVSKARLGRRIGKLNEEGMKLLKVATCIHENITPEILDILMSKMNDNK